MKSAAAPEFSEEGLRRWWSSWKGSWPGSCVGFRVTLPLVSRLHVHAGWLYRELMETMVEEKAEDLQDRPWRPTPRKHPSKKAFIFQSPSHTLFLTGVTFAIWDVCPQPSRRVSSDTLHAPRSLHLTAPSPAIPMTGDNLWFIKMKDRSGKHCPESDGTVYFMTFSGLSSHHTSGPL